MKIPIKDEEVIAAKEFCEKYKGNKDMIPYTVQDGVIKPFEIIKSHDDCIVAMIREDALTTKEEIGLVRINKVSVMNSKQYNELFNLSLSLENFKIIVELSLGDCIKER